MGIFDIFTNVKKTKTDELLNSKGVHGGSLSSNNSKIIPPVEKKIEEFNIYNNSDDMIRSGTTPFSFSYEKNKNGLYNIYTGNQLVDVVDADGLSKYNLTVGGNEDSISSVGRYSDNKKVLIDENGYEYIEFTVSEEYATAWSISNASGVSLEAITLYNRDKIKDISALSVGTTVKVPLNKELITALESEFSDENTLYGDGLYTSYVEDAKSSGSMVLPDVKLALNWKAYEGYGAFGVEDETAPQYYWKSKYGDKVAFDEQGFAYIYDSEGIKNYVVAMGSFYGNVGDKFMIEMKNEDGKVSYINVVLGDSKADEDTDATNRYQIESPDSMNMLEFTGDVTSMRTSIVKNLYGEEAERLLETSSLDDLCTGNIADANDLFSGTITGVYKLDDTKQDLNIDDYGW